MTDGQATEDLAVAALALARRFAAGATLWAVAPRWPAHARHVAVEFVHPVVVGTRALPAVAVDGTDPVAILHASVRPGDVVLTVAGADDAVATDLVRRAPGWAVATVWIGGGARRPAARPDHLLWVDDPDPLLPHAGGLLRRYHVLWEMVHVCFEHPGLLEPGEVDEAPPRQTRVGETAP